MRIFNFPIVPLRRKAAFGVLGLAAIIALLATVCAGVTIASMHVYQAGNQGIQRLQLQAAAEGGAIAALEGIPVESPTSRTLTLGDCLIEFENPTKLSDSRTSATFVGGGDDTSRTLVAMKVTLMQKSRPVAIRNYAITLATDSLGKPGILYIEARQ